MKKLGDAFASVLRDQLVAQGLADAASLLTPTRRRAAGRAPDRRAPKPPTARSRKGSAGDGGARCSGNPTPALQKSGGARHRRVGNTGLRVHGRQPSAVLREHRRARPWRRLQKARPKPSPAAVPKLMIYQLESGCELPGWSSVSFVRPAHGLVALHGAEVVAVAALGLESGAKRTAIASRRRSTRSCCAMPTAMRCSWTKKAP